MKSCISILLLFSVNHFTFSQDYPPTSDSVIIQQDSLFYNLNTPEKISEEQDSVKYKKIESFSSKSKVLGVIYRFLFKPLDPVEKSQSPEIIEESFYHRLGHGKKIRSIRITPIDPFGFGLKDSSIVVDNNFFRIGNWLHAKTNQSVISNLLLFKENDVYDSLKVRESERLIRSQKYVRDVYLYVDMATSDSVDLNIRVQDVWSTLPSIRTSGSKPGFGITDLNFAGTGSTLRANTWWNNGQHNVTHLSYLMPNIRNTYTSLNIQYLFSPGGKLNETTDFNRYFYSPVSYDPQYMFSENSNIIRSIEINRPFFSTFTKVAGGIFAGQMITTQNYRDIFDTLRYQSAKTNINDFWMGRSLKITNPLLPDGVSSLVFSGRYVRIASPHKTTITQNNDLFKTHNYLFWGISMSTRLYYRDRFIFNYEKTEDVPAGMIAGVTIGKDYHEKKQFYLGLNMGWGSYYPLGYLSSHLSYGTFKGSAGLEQGILTGRITYFTNLLSMGRWKLRQFIRPSFVYGIKRSPFDNQPIKIGIKGFESTEQLASDIFVISLQTQSYAPRSIAGFHFGPYFFSHFGILNEDPLSAGNKNYYSLMGLGVLIKNDYLMFDTFEVSISFYPYIPGRGYDIIKTNAYKASDYGFRQFQVSKPGIVE
ncbi:MAG TPA: hypothetical protein VHO50_02585 [Bacteroidales bacterium]|nr:hypothetical protein [Bacteroidales bacterium]